MTNLAFSSFSHFSRNCARRYTYKQKPRAHNRTIKKLLVQEPENGARSHTTLSEMPLSWRGRLRVITLAPPASCPSTTCTSRARGHAPLRLADQAQLAIWHAAAGEGKRFGCIDRCYLLGICLLLSHGRLKLEAPSYVRIGVATRGELRRICWRWR